MSDNPYLVAPPAPGNSNRVDETPFLANPLPNIGDEDQAPPPANPYLSTYGLRNDGTPKGQGFFGPLKRPDGKVSTEISIGVEFDGKETEIPSLVPTLTQKEIDHLLAGGEPTKAIVDKAVAHARQRMAQGLSPFQEDQEEERKTVNPYLEEAAPPALENPYLEAGVGARALNALVSFPKGLTQTTGQSISGAARNWDTAAEGILLTSQQTGSANPTMFQRRRAFEAAMNDPRYFNALAEAGDDPAMLERAESLFGPKGKLAMIRAPIDAANKMAGQESLAQQERLKESPTYMYGQGVVEAGKEIYKTDPYLDTKVESQLMSALGSTAPTVGLGLVPVVGTPLGVTQYAMSSSEDMAQEAIESGHPELATPASVAGTFIGAVSEGAIGATSRLKGILRNPRLLKSMEEWAERNPIKAAVLSIAVREGAQEGVEQAMQNVTASDLVGYDPYRPWYENVLKSAGLGTATGVLIGGSASALTGRRRAPSQEQEQEAAIEQIGNNQARQSVEQEYAGGRRSWRQQQAAQVGLTVEDFNAQHTAQQDKSKQAFRAGLQEGDTLEVTGDEIGPNEAGDRQRTRKTTKYTVEKEGGRLVATPEGGGAAFGLEPDSGLHFFNALAAPIMGGKILPRMLKVSALPRAATTISSPQPPAAGTITGPSSEPLPGKGDERTGSAMPAERQGRPKPVASSALSERPRDIIDAIEGDVAGKIDPKLIREANTDWKPVGAARRLFRKGGRPADVVLQGLARQTGASFGLREDADLAELGDAINAAALARQEWRRQNAKQDKAIDREAKQLEQFEKRVVAGERPKAQARNVERVRVDGLVEGDVFEVQDHKFEVEEMEFDEDGEVVAITVKDGDKFGVQKINPSQIEVIHIDKGTFKAVPREEWLSPDEAFGTPADEEPPALHEEAPVYDETPPAKMDAMERADQAFVISESNPSGKDSPDPLKGNIQANRANRVAQPGATTMLGLILRHYPNLRAMKGTGQQVLDAFHAHIVDNLLWLFHVMPPGMRDRAIEWYKGANKLMRRWAVKYGQPRQAVAGVMAALSPGTDWFINVEMARRVLEFWRAGKRRTVDDKMLEWVARQLAKQKTKVSFDKVTLWQNDFVEWNRKGTRFGKLASREQALFLRAWDESRNPAHFYEVYPDGTFAKQQARNDDGTLARINWQSLDNIEKALSVLRTPTKANISLRMGWEHKVRNFYNNILSPSNASAFTGDTHAVAAALLRPLGGKALEVAHNFGSAPARSGYRGSGGYAHTGASGTYGLIADAYRDAAGLLRLLPRELQSAVWEAANRWLFPAGYKNTNQSKLIEDAWQRYKRGEISLKQVRRETLKHTIGHRLGAGAYEAALARAERFEELQLRREALRVGGASNAGSVSGPDIHGGRAGRTVARGTGGTTAPKVSEVTIDGTTYPTGQSPAALHEARRKAKKDAQALGQLNLDSLVRGGS